jgi:hypothetical protein
MLQDRQDFMHNPSGQEQPMERVDPLWKVVQEGLESRSTARIQDHPFVKFYMLNEGRYPDFVQRAQDAHPDVFAGLLQRYRERGSGALDEDERGVLAPTSRTAQHLYYLTRLVARLGDFSGLRICEIGGGYGNMMRIFTQLGLCAEYDIVDIAGVVDLQRRYADEVLTPDERSRTRVFNVEDDKDLAELTARPYDIVMSFFAVTEAPHDMRQWYLDKVLLPAPFVYLAGQDRWRNQEVGEHVCKALADRFSLDRKPFFWASDHESETFELFADRRLVGAV